MQIVSKYHLPYAIGSTISILLALSLQEDDI